MFKLNFKKFLKLKFILIFGVVLVFIALFLVISYHLQKELTTIYQKRESLILKDRYGEEILIKPNQKGHFAIYLDEVPPRFKELLIKKEDQWFYWHFGFNPWSIIRGALGYFGFYHSRASSTITQQLVKILLGKEFERSIKNKIIESFYTLALEIFHSKEEILKMYVNSIYFGNQAQGLVEASKLYFGTSPDFLTDGQTLQLLTTISSPTEQNPSKLRNEELARNLAKKFGLDNKKLIMTDFQTVKKNMENYHHLSNLSFELSPWLEKDQIKCQRLTLDKEINKKIRAILIRNIEDLRPKNVKNGAAIVIKLPENELLALVGSPNPNSSQDGYKINMLLQPRPIGSTIKPLIYLKAFEKGLRPYTLVEDREYKYITAIGFPLYPKNFDYKYRGEVSLHYALSNSLNVPAVKVLEYVGLENFYKFLEEDLEFQPVQSLDNYQLGIALGALEMNLLDLAKYFTIFPNEGRLTKLKICKNEGGFERKIAEEKYVQLINKILSDRKTGIEQFGLKSDINLFQKNYALKTGTSRDFRDSWIIGFTPDFLVGVWLGNTDNTSTEGISGQVGAGRIWSEIMDLLFNSEYNKKTPFEFNFIREFYGGNNIEYGLSDDDYEKSKNALKEKELSLILNPHEGDVFLLEENTKIILKASQSVNWFVNGKFLGESEEKIFLPQETGQYKIRAENKNGFWQAVTINLIE